MSKSDRATGARLRRVTTALACAVVLASMSAVISTSVKDASAEAAPLSNNTSSVGTGLNQEPEASASAAGITGSEYQPLVPARLLETRPGSNTVDGASAGEGVRRAGSVTDLPVVGRGGVGSDAAAVVLNVTAVSPAAAGFVTVYPCGAERPTASSLNFAAGDVVANAVVVKVGDGGRVCLYTMTDTDLVVDVNGWFGANTDVETPANTVVVPGGSVVVGAAGADGSVPVVLQGDAPQGVEVGKILATTTADGAYYGRVLSVTGSTATTQPVSLAAIFPDLSLSVDADLATGQVNANGSTSNLRQQFKMLQLPGLQPLGQRLRTSCEGIGGFSGAVDVWVQPDLQPGRFEFDADWSVVKGVTRLRAVYAPRLSVQLDTSTDASFDCSLVYGLFGLNLDPIEFTIGGVPVIITQHLSGKLQLNVHVEAGVATSISASTGLDLGFDDVDGNFSLVKDAFATIGSEPSFSVKGNVSIELPVTYSARAYGLLGLDGTITPYLGVEYDPDKGMFPAVTAGVKAQLTFVMGLFDWLELRHDFPEQPLVGPLVIWSRLELPSDPPAALAGLPYNGQVPVAGGKAPYTWTAGSLPAGLSLNTAGVLSGSIAATGTYDVPLTVRDSGGQVRTKTLHLLVQPVTQSILDKFGKIVRLPDGRSWYVDLRGTRHSIPDGGTYQCLTAQGKTVVNVAVESDLAPFVVLEDAQCVRADPGNIVRTSDGDSYLLNSGFTRSWIPDGGTYRCLEVNAHAVVNNVPRYYIDDLTQAANFVWSCWDATAARGRSVRSSDGSSWYVDLRGGRHWMPDGGTYQCIVAQGKTDYGNVVPAEWVNALPQYENAQCVQAGPGQMVRHNDGDAYYLDGWTLRWIDTGASYNCLAIRGVGLVNGVPRYWIDDLAHGATMGTGSSCNIIVRHSVDGDAHLIDGSGIRHWIPTGAIYNCLVGRGYPVINTTNRTAINTWWTEGSWASC
jgi:hypothetical protein